VVNDESQAVNGDRQAGHLLNVKPIIVSDLLSFFFCL